MDIFTIEKLMGCADVTPAQKLVMIALAITRPTAVSIEGAFRAGALKDKPILYEVGRVLKSECGATPKTLSEMTNYTVRQVRNILRALYEKGLVEMEGRKYILRLMGGTARVV